MLESTARKIVLIYQEEGDQDKYELGEYSSWVKQKCET
jgi:hypothetical protein